MGRRTRGLLAALLGVALALVAVLGTARTAYADTSYTVTFSANDNVVTEENVTLPKTYKVDYQSETGNLDIIIKQLYNKTSGYMMSLITVSDSQITTQSQGGNQAYSQFTIPAGYTGTFTASGDYRDPPIWANYNYSLSVQVAENYPLWVGGTQVTSANATDTESHPTWSYDAESNTLTLNGYSFDGTQSEPQSKYGIRYEGKAELAIVLEGDSSVKGTQYGVLSPNCGSVSITGDGSLTAVGGTDAGIEVYGGDLTIDGNVAVTGAKAGIIAIHSNEGGNVTIDGGKVTATATATDADAGISAMDTGSITINSGTVTAEGRNGIKSDDGNVTIAGGEVTATGKGSWSSGVGGKSVAIEGGTVTATASGESSSGISSVQGTTIGGGTVTASGSDYAIYGTVTNAIPGVGWTNAAGTEGKTRIPTSESGQKLTYLKAQFPAHEVTYRVANGTWSDGGTKEKTEPVAHGSKPDGVPTGMRAAEGYAGGAWDTDPASATITEATTFTYTFTAIPTYEVTYKVVNGTWSDGSTTDKTESVQSGAKPASVPTGMKAAEGYEGGAWDTDPASATITGATTFTFSFTKKDEPVVIPDASVTPHVQRVGWMDPVTDGTAAGTTGKSRRMEALTLKLPDSVAGGIEYRGHVQRSGWEKDWKADGAQSGTTGKSRRMEAVQIQLTGEAKDAYDVYYRVHSQRYGWMAWAKNGEEAGTQGMSRRAEAIQVVLVKKDAPAPDATYKGVTQQYAKAFAKK